MPAATALSLPGSRFLVNLLRKHQSNTFLRNLGSMGAAQLVIRLVRLASTVFISRLLLPADYGMAAIALTVYELVSLFTRNGISAQVVQAADDEVDAVAMAAYRMTWIICLALMGLQIAAAWPVAWLYGNAGLAGPIAAMSVIYLATPVSSIQAAFQSRESRLGRIAMAGAAQTIADNLLTIALAYLGYGLWAIILPKILVAPLWIYFVRYGHSWRPHKLKPGEPRADWRKLLRFSRNVMGVELMSTLQANIDNVLVGYFLGVHALGLYFFAFNSGLGISLGLISAAGVAVYPHFCEARGNRSELLNRLSKTRKTLAKTFLPLILAQAALAPIYVPLVFGHRWVEAIPVLSVICLSALVRPFANASSQFLKAVGRPEIEFRWQSVNLLVLVAALAIAAQFSIFAVAVAVFLVQSLMLGSFALIAPQLALRGKPQPAARNEALVLEIASDDEALGRLVTDWNALWLRVPGALASQSFGYCDAALKAAQAHGKGKLFVLTIRAAGKLVALWPLLKSQHGLITRLSALNSGGTEYDALLIDPAADVAAIVALMHQAVAEQVKADVLHLPFVVEGSAQDAHAQAGGWMATSATLAAPLVGLRGFASFEDYWKSLSSNLRNGTKRRRRRLDELGPVEMKFETEAGPRREAILWALQQKADWLARKKMGNDFITTPRFREFLLAYALQAGQHAGLSVLTLRLKGEIIACKVGTFDQTCFEGFITVYDPAYENYSPGVHLLQMNLEWCAATGRDYDFRIGDEAYKASWATGSCQRTTYVQALTLKGVAFLLVSPAVAFTQRFALRGWKFARLLATQPHVAARRLTGLRPAAPKLPIAGEMA